MIYVHNARSGHKYASSFWTLTAALGDVGDGDEEAECVQFMVFF